MGGLGEPGDGEGEDWGGREEGEPCPKGIAPCSCEEKGRRGQRDEGGEGDEGANSKP